MEKGCDGRDEEGYLKEILYHFQNHMESEGSHMRHHASAWDQGLNLWSLGLGPLLIE
jgi:hypothetical protein